MPTRSRRIERSPGAPMTTSRSRCVRTCLRDGTGGGVQTGGGISAGMARYGGRFRLDAYAWLPLLYETHVLLRGRAAQWLIRVRRVSMGRVRRHQPHRRQGWYRSSAPVRWRSARSGHVAAVRRLPRLLRLPRMPTGFPSPAEDVAEAPLDLNDLLAPRPAATFYAQVSGDALLDAVTCPQ